MDYNRLMYEGQKTRNGTVLVYSEHVDEDTLDMYLEDMGIKVARSPLHDQDVYDRASVTKWDKRHKNPTEEELTRRPVVGAKKKPHWHVTFQLSGPRGLAYILKMFPSELGVTSVWKEPDPEHALRYLCHLDSKKKVQYDKAGVVGFGGIDLSPLDKLTDNDKANDVAYICKYVRENDCTNFFELTNWVLDQNDIDLFNSLLRYTAFFTNYQQGKKTSRKAKAV